MADISSLSDAELQRLYWTMKLDTDEAIAINDRIAEELSRRKIGIAQALRDSGDAIGD